MAPGPALPSKSLLTLAPFSHTWVGGDIHGLASFAGTLYGYVPGMESVITALDKQVSQIVTDAGWQGSAATAFSGNWEKVSAEVSAVGLVVIQAGGIVDQLAANLASIENALESAAGQAASHGVQIGAAGQPPDVCYADPTKESWRVSYSDFYQRCLNDANDARVQAAGDLNNLSTAATSGKPSKDGGGGDDAPSGTEVGIGEGNSIADLLADMLATPTAYSREATEKVEEAEKALKKAKAAWAAAQKAARTADGRFGTMPDDVKASRFKAKGELETAEDTLTKAKGSENAITKLLGTRASDVPGASKLAAGLEEGSLLRTAADVPVVDVLAGGVMTVLNARADQDAGVPGWVAYPLETANTVGTIALATVVGGAVAGAAVFAGAPALGVAAGVAAGVVVAYGVGDYVHNYIADMPEQWREHGALGILTDFGAAGVSTGHDVAHLGSDVGHLATGAWHGITHGIGSLF
jgi:uncharacterized protein YukE